MRPILDLSSDVYTLLHTLNVVASSNAPRIAVQRSSALRRHAHTNNYNYIYLTTEYL